MLLQEMEGCDTEQDSVDSLPIDSDEAVETSVTTQAKGKKIAVIVHLYMNVTAGNGRL